MSEPASNAALERLDALVGDWNVEGRHRLLPSTVNGTASFTWLENGSFLVFRSQTANEDIPDGVSIIACDDVTGRYTQSYADTRGVHRIYQMSLEGTAWKLWREAPGFSQRFNGSFSEGGGVITGVWELSTDGSTWENDLELKYTKVR